MIEKRDDEFHIGDILTALTGWVLSPNGAQGAAELTNYMFGEKRTNYIGKEGIVFNYHTVIVPRFKQCAPYLAEKFPELAEYAKKLTLRNFLVIDIDSMVLHLKNGWEKLKKNLVKL